MGIKRTVLIRRIDLLGSEPLELKKMKQKMQKTEMSILPMYFWTNSFVKSKSISYTVAELGFLFRFFLLIRYVLAHTYPIEPESKTNFLNFHYALLTTSYW